MQKPPRIGFTARAGLRPQDGGHYEIMPRPDRSLSPIPVSGLRVGSIGLPCKSHAPAGRASAFPHEDCVEPIFADLPVANVLSFQGVVNALVTAWATSRTLAGSASLASAG